MKLQWLLPRGRSTLNVGDALPKHQTGEWGDGHQIWDTEILGLGDRPDGSVLVDCRALPRFGTAIEASSSRNDEDLKRKQPAPPKNFVEERHGESQNPPNIQLKRRLMEVKSTTHPLTHHCLVLQPKFQRASQLAQSTFDRSPGHLLGCSKVGPIHPTKN